MSSNKSKKPDHAFRVIARLLSYMVLYKKRLIVVTICMVASAYSVAQGTALLIPAINDYIVPLIGKQEPSLSGFLFILGKMTLFYVIGAVASWLQGKIMVSVSNGTLFTIRSELFEAMEKMPLSYFNTHSQGSVISLFSNDINAMNDMLRQGIPRIVNGAVTCAFIFVTMLYTNWRLAIIVLACEFLLVIFLKTLVRKNSIQFVKQQKNIGTLTSLSEEYVSGRYTVKVFGQEKNACDIFNDVNEDLYRSEANSIYYSDTIFNLTNGLSNIGFAFVAVIGAVFTIYNMADIGTVGTFLQYYRNLFRPMTDISKQFNNILSALAGAERVFEFLDGMPEEDSGNVSVELIDNNLMWKIPDEENGFRYVRFEGKIRFDHVDFEYEKGKKILSDFTLDIEPHKKTAFVGTTGAGKTTVINLLSRFYEISAGTITCDGIDIRNICKKDLRKVAGLVLQEINLFTGSIEENIKFGNENSSFEDIESAAKLVCADSFINQLSDEYNTWLTDNGKPLSQGQRQLLSLARAAVTNAPILVLDEATSSVDSRTEMLINNGLDALMKDKTVLVIAHRLSTIKNADKIVVLDKGCIVESGTYAELMRRQGVFYNMNS